MAKVLRSSLENCTQYQLELLRIYRLYKPMNTIRQYSIDEVNQMNSETFIDVFGSVFEHSPWAAEQAYANLPVASLRELQDSLCRAVLESSEKAQLGLLCAHPELGSKDKMARASVHEQAAAGINRADEARRSRMLELNQSYREKFDFPFIVAVKGLSPDDILDNMQARITNSRDDEFQECLSQVMRIATFRIEALIQDSSCRE